MLKETHPKELQGAKKPKASIFVDEHFIIPSDA